MSNSASNDQLMEVFLFEMSTLLEQLDEILLHSEKTGSLTEDSVNETFRIMHTIKGSSAMMEFDIISSVTHKLEDTFFIIRDQGIDQAYFTELFDLMLDATDFLKSQLEAIQNGEQLATGNDALIARALALKDKLSGKGNDACKEAQHVTSPVVALPEDTDINCTGGSCYLVHVLFEEDCGMENLRAFMLINTLQSTCSIHGFEPTDIESNSEAASEILVNGFSITLTTQTSEAELKAVIDNSLHVKFSTITPIVKDGGTNAQPPVEEIKSVVTEETAKNEQKKAPVPIKPIKQDLINVSLSKLDELMNLMGELVITESMVLHSPDLKGIGTLDNFHKSARQLLKLTDELQDMVMSVRMIPVSGTFQKMQRIVRDMCRNLGKECELVTVGEDTDIDKTIIDAIADPIMHLVRNSMDHGVEMPENRMQAGKPAKATITLSAENTGGEILITISDDGKGLDAQALLEKAKKNGILTKPINEYTEKEAFMLLFAPGFSTKESVTEYSGRGVGMDVVRKNIEKIGGTVSIDSKKGHGMIVYLKIPLTLAIVDGMDISVGDGIYTLQITSINESFKAKKEQLIVDTQGNEMIMIRGEVFPIIRLYELYNTPNAITNIEDGILIWVNAGEQSACLFADQLIGEQQIVVKPLPFYLKRYDIKSFGIMGCTVLGDGNITLILDVASIIDKVLIKK